MPTIRKRGDRWQVQVRRQGHKPISKSFLIRRDAERWATTQERQIDLEIATGAKRNTPAALSVRDMLARYRDQVLPQKSCGKYERYLVDALARQPFAGEDISKLPVSALAAYRESRLATVGGSIIRRELGVLSHAYETARVEWGFDGLANPVKQMRKPKSSPPRARRLAAGEWINLIVSLNASHNRLLHDVALFAMETAMRMGEILSATGKYFDPNRATLVLPNSKNGHARTIPLSPTAMGMLLGKDHHAHALLFPTTTCAIKQAWKRATKRAGIVDLHFHDLRHEAISRLFERGLSLPEVALISGHRDPRMLLRYTHLEVSNVAAKLKRLESPIDA